MKDNFYYGDIDYHDLEYCYKEIEKISERCMILL